MLCFAGGVGCIQSEVISHPPENQAGSGGESGGSAGEGGGSGSDSGAASGSGSGAASGSGNAPGTDRPDAAPPDSTACGALALDACSVDVNCSVLVGQKITGAPACIAPPVRVACVTNQGCTLEMVRATDPMGSDWILPNTCLPVGWTDATIKGTRFDACPAQ